MFAWVLDEVLCKIKLELLVPGYEFIFLMLLLF